MAKLRVSMILACRSDDPPRRFSNKIVVNYITRFASRRWGFNLEDYGLSVEWAGKKTDDGFPVIKVTGPVESVLRFACYVFSLTSSNPDNPFTDRNLRNVMFAINAELTPLFQVVTARSRERQVSAEIVDGDLVVKVI